MTDYALPDDMDVAATGGVISEVSKERVAQHRKWGEQTLPWVSELPRRATTGTYPITTEGQAKFITNRAAEVGDLTYADVLIEEVAEAVDAETTEGARAELVQVAAVAVAAIESIDREAP